MAGTIVEGRRSSGVLAAAVGASVATAVALVPAIPLVHRASDHELGWWHDPDGGLLFAAALLLWLAIGIGTWAGLRLRGHRGAAAAGALALPTVPVLGFLVIQMPSTLYLLPAASGAAARFLTRRSALERSDT